MPRALPVAAVAVELLDPAFGEAAVHAHIPLVGGSAGALHRIGPSHHFDVQIPGAMPPLQGLNDFAQRVVTQDESFHSRGGTP